MSDLAGRLDDPNGPHSCDLVAAASRPGHDRHGGLSHSKRPDGLDRLHAQGNLNKSWRCD
jgi:hypothetical protein